MKVIVCRGGSGVTGDPGLVLRNPLHTGHDRLNGFVASHHAASSVDKNFNCNGF